jgi:hypothetical protein
LGIKSNQPDVKNANIRPAKWIASRVPSQYTRTIDMHNKTFLKIT